MATINLGLAYRKANKQGESIRAICARSGLATETVHKISRNRGDPKFSTLVAIAEAFGLTLLQFLDLGRDEKLGRLKIGPVTERTSEVRQTSAKKRNTRNGKRDR